MAATQKKSEIFSYMYELFSRHVTIITDKCPNPLCLKLHVPRRFEVDWIQIEKLRH